MPIYAYRCEACGLAKDVLQKLSDPNLSVCPFCGADAFRKQVTAAGFQLKGSGWYATDFKHNNSGPKSTSVDASEASKPADSSGDAGAAASSTTPAPAAAGTATVPAATANTSASTKPTSTSGSD